MRPGSFRQPQGPEQLVVDRLDGEVGQGTLTVFGLAGRRETVGFTLGKGGPVGFSSELSCLVQKNLFSFASGPGRPTEVGLV